MGGTQNVKFVKFAPSNGSHYSVLNSTIHNRDAYTGIRLYIHVWLSIEHIQCPIGFVYIAVSVIMYHT